MDIEHLDRIAHDLGGLPEFQRPTPGQRTTGHLPMADVAIGGRDEFHVMAQFAP
jgi:hypothetical protein